METWEIKFYRLPTTTVIIRAISFDEAIKIARGRPEIRDAVMAQIIADYTNGAEGKRLSHVAEGNNILDSAAQTLHPG